MRKKLYKAGKLWVAAAVSITGLAIGSTSLVLADTNNATVTGTQNNQNNNDTAPTNPLNNNNQTTNIVVNGNGTSSNVDDNGTVKTNDGSAMHIQNFISGLDGHYEIQSDGSAKFILKSGQALTGLHQIDGVLHYFDDSTGNQVKGAVKTFNSETYYFLPGSGDAATGIQTVNGRVYGFDTDFKQVKNSFLADSNDNTYYFDVNGQIASGLQSIKDRKYFIDGQGRVVKGGQQTVDGITYYLDGKDGHATPANQDQYNTETRQITNIYSEHNQIATTDQSSIDNINGYVTAASWYRPKDILQDGQNWVATQSDTRRPLLMTWWPNKKTQVAYINYMKAQGLYSGNTVDTDTTSQDDLNIAVMAIQALIERKISSDGTDWLYTDINNFIKTQDGWNLKSESPSASDGLQGGTLTYDNSQQTPWANSDYRYLNRTPSNQTGQGSKLGGYEFLLANDVDNSNPVVQAEQLNWLYYLMNFGSITANDSDANFDGYRIDAVDNVDADLMQIAAQYMREAYGVDKNNATANKHLSILEDWDYDDYSYTGKMGSDQLTMDFKTQVQMIASLSKTPGQRDGLNRFLEWYNVNRSKDNTQNQAIANYSFLRAHDSQVQTIIADIINENYPGADGFRPTADQLANAFKIYNADQQSTNKRYTLYNVPASYAMLLTNKDTVPRVYYGDLFTDDGQYMSAKSPYYDAISQLLQDRIKYVAGGQTMSTGTIDKNTNQNTGRNDVLTSIRFGKNLMNASDVDSQGNTKRTDGMGVIISNNATLKLNSAEKVVLHMGASHRNQLFRASLLTTKKGLNVFNSDNGAPTMMTDNNGDLIFDSSWIYGVSDPQVSGYLSVWVPVGASNNQDSRSLDQASAADSLNDGKTLHSNAALDSNVIYEGFSNFQSMPTQESEYTNVKIAQNANLFKSWGVTSFQFAPQYRSSNDSTFIDSIIKNGYSFTDRYDLGFNEADGSMNPTKYGTDAQLRSAIKAVHSVGIQAIADWVPDQLYSLPGEEAVTATRTNGAGVPVEGSNFNNLVYIANTKSSGTDFQSVYGGAFLEKMKALYPDLFKINQTSTGKPIDGSQRITQWSAKYLNGTNLLGRGAYFVVSDAAAGRYFMVDSKGNYFLPMQLLNQNAYSGFVRDSRGVRYYSDNGYQAINTFIQDDQGNWYYFDQNGYMVTGVRAINGSSYAFLSNGIELHNNFWTDDSTGRLYYLGNDGKMIQGFRIIKGEAYDFGSDNSYYLKSRPSGYYQDGNNFEWFENGVKYTGFKNYNNGYYYFDNGSRVDNAWKSSWGNQYYLGSDGRVVQGIQVVDNQAYDFGTDGTYNLKGRPSGYFQSKTGWMWFENGQPYTGFQNYYGAYYWFQNGVRQEDSWETAWGLKYYVGSDGRTVQGVQTVDNHAYNFGTDGTFFLKGTASGYLYDGSLANGGYRWYEDGNLYTGFRYYYGTYYWFIDGVRQNAGWREAWGMKYYTDENGRAIQGIHVIDGMTYDFGNDGTYYSRPISGYLYDGSPNNGGYRWYENGQLYTGFRYYMGTFYWFVDGVRQNAGWREAWGLKYYTDETGRAIQGTRMIDGVLYNFGEDGTFYVRPLSGYIHDGYYVNGGYRWYEDGNLYTGFHYYMGTYYWFVDGVRQNAGWREAWGMKYYTDQDGRAVQGHQNIDGTDYYFGDNGTYFLR
ncbi:Glucan-binding domain (YG repeat) [Fructobacillus fructosus]|uniref:glycoside hydrolase family 70 protein n=1 Tax=Fructobacillus fructosus TaxID=1631 RepID=UPI002D9A5F20|nr:Glucan-binding domain (YG repeat) [Fructobacillus fructosus]